MFTAQEEIEIRQMLEEWRQRKPTVTVKMYSSPDNEIMVMPLLGRGEWTVYRDDLNGWVEAFPGIVVFQELLKAKQWLIDNPRNQKTARGIRRFIYNWLSRAQDRAPRQKLEPEDVIRKFNTSVLDELRKRNEQATCEALEGSMAGIIEEQE